eukprot:813823-Amphidinium_carterae.2
MEDAGWGMFIADALAMPTHWFYGGKNQVEAVFGVHRCVLNEKYPMLHPAQRSCPQAGSTWHSSTALLHCDRRLVELGVCTRWIQCGNAS